MIQLLRTAANELIIRLTDGEQIFALLAVTIENHPAVIIAHASELAEIETTCRQHGLTVLESVNVAEFLELEQSGLLDIGGKSDTIH